MTATAIITAGGSGSRFRGNLPKQFLPIHNLPMIVHTLRAFENAQTISAVIVTLPKDELQRLNAAELSRYEIRKVINVVPGGITRQESVAFGLNAIGDSPQWVAIHDAARCLITPMLIDQTVRACKGWDGAITALPVRDTLKQVNGTTIERTLPRTGVWAMQTPQVFRFPFIRDAYRKAAAEKFEATDDAAIAEYIGGKIRVVEGSMRNFKVTFQDDLELAEQLMTGET